MQGIFNLFEVIEMLDSMKKGKENYVVRDTIKWLERELKSGNKYVVKILTLLVKH